MMQNFLKRTIQYVLTITEIFLTRIVFTTSPPTPLQCGEGSIWEMILHNIGNASERLRGIL